MTKGGARRMTTNAKIYMLLGRAEPYKLFNARIHRSGMLITGRTVEGVRVSYPTTTIGTIVWEDVLDNPKEVDE